MVSGADKMNNLCKHQARVCNELCIWKCMPLCKCIGLQCVSETMNNESDFCSLLLVYEARTENAGHFETLTMFI